MFSTLISFDRRALRLSSLVLVGTAMLAACDSDQPVAPTTKALPTEASASAGTPTGSLYITITDQNGVVPSMIGAQFTVNASTNPTQTTKTLFLVDNGSGDTNPMANKLTMALTSGPYTVCQTVAPTGYVLPSTKCQTVIVGGIVAASLTFVDPTVGHLTWAVKDWGTNLVGGATFTFDDGSGPVSILDDSAIDLDKTPGKFEIVAPKSGELCPTTPPARWSFGSFCQTASPVAGATTFVYNFGVNADYSMYWQANNYKGLAGPSTYTITGLGGLYHVTITDGDKPDRWTDMGTMWILLPAPGDYQLCQTVPPPMTMLATPACVTVTVGFAVPAYGGMYMNYPL